MVGRSPQSSVGSSKSVLAYALHSIDKPDRPGSISGVSAKIIIIKGNKVLGVFLIII